MSVERQKIGLKALNTLILAGLLTAQFARAQEEYSVADGYECLAPIVIDMAADANVRDLPSTDAGIVGRFTAGTDVEVQEVIDGEMAITSELWFNVGDVDNNGDDDFVSVDAIGGVPDEVTEAGSCNPQDLLPSPTPSPEVMAADIFSFDPEAFVNLDGNGTGGAIAEGGAEIQLAYDYVHERAVNLFGSTYGDDQIRTVAVNNGRTDGFAWSAVSYAQTDEYTDVFWPLVDSDGDTDIDRAAWNPLSDSSGNGLPGWGILRVPTATGGVRFGFDGTGAVPLAVIVNGSGEPVGVLNTQMPIAAGDGGPADLRIIVVTANGATAEELDGVLGDDDLSSGGQGSDGDRLVVSPNETVYMPADIPAAHIAELGLDQPLSAEVYVQNQMMWDENTPINPSQIFYGPIDRESYPNSVVNQLARFPVRYRGHFFDPNAEYGNNYSFYWEFQNTDGSRRIIRSLIDYNNNMPASVPVFTIDGYLADAFTPGQGLLDATNMPYVNAPFEDGSTQRMVDYIIGNFEIGDPVILQWGFDFNNLSEGITRQYREARDALVTAIINGDSQSGNDPVMLLSEFGAIYRQEIYQ